MAKLKVTQQDIDCGIRCDTQSCAVALALSRAYPKVFFSVRGNKILTSEEPWPWSDETRVRIFNVSKEIQKFIFAFDNLRPVSPCELELPGPLVEALGPPAEGT